MIKARVRSLRGLGAADPFASSYRNDLIGQQLSLGAQFALSEAPKHLIAQAPPPDPNADPEIGIHHSECQQILEASDYYGAPEQHRAAMLSMCSQQGTESFLASLEAAGIETSVPWYKKPVVWVVGGGVVLLGAALFMRSR